MRALLRPILLSLPVALAALGAHAAVPASAPAPDLQKSFPEIRTLLASSDFAQRQAGQKLLDALAPSELNTLRALAKSESDPEVKSRLDNRITALELYALVHPPAFSLHLKDASLADACQRLSTQLGNDVQLVAPTNPRGAAGIAAGSITLDVDNLPFWDIMLRLQRQDPFTISAATIISTGSYRSRISLSRTTAAPVYQRIDTFLVNPTISGNPASGSWTIRLAFYADPRVRITQYSYQPRIAKLVDQDGISILPAVSSSSSVTLSSLSRPASNWTSTISLNPAPGIKTVKELRAAVDIAILEKETSLAIDLTKPVDPIATSRGTLTVENDLATNRLTVRFAPKPADPFLPGASSPAPYTSYRVINAAGTAVTTTYSSSTQITLSPNAANGPPAKLEITWPESSRTMTLPVELHDIPAPPPPAPAPNPVEIDLPIRILP
jgi:hypothetical protein